MKTNTLYKLFFFSIAQFFVFIYITKIGPIVFMGDTHLFALRAKSIALEGNLNLSGGSFIYPPLYAMFMSIGYLFSQPELTHKVILLINGILMGSIFFPINKILIRYSKVQRKYSSPLACILTLSPFLLPYSSMFMSEVIYFPILFWLMYFFICSLEEKKIKNFIGVGIFLALALLVRTASNVLLLSIILIYSIEFIYNFFNKKETLKKLFFLYSIFFLAFIFVFGLWKLYEKIYVVYENGGASYIDLNIVKSIFSNRKEFDHHVSWFLNAIKYYLTSPLTISAIFTLVIVFLNPVFLLKDLFISFTFIVSIGAALSIVLITSSSWGGTTLTWNRYFAPYVIFYIFISIRYLYLLNWYTFRIIFLGLLFMLLANAPSDLGCHFPDSLILFMENLAEWRIIPFIKTYFILHPPALIANIAFLIICITPVLLYLTFKNKTKYFISVIFICLIYFFANYSSYKYWGNSGDLQLKNYKNGIGHYLYKEFQQDKAISVYLDNSLYKYFFQFFRIQFFVPFKVNTASVREIQNLRDKNIFYVTDKQITNNEILHSENPGIFLYNLKKNNIEKEVLYSFEKGIGNLEDSEYNGEKIKVRWLESNCIIKSDLMDSRKLIEVRLKISSYLYPRTIRIKLNGKKIDKFFTINSIQNKDFFQDINFSIMMNPGENNLELYSEEESGELTGGRKVAFFLLNDPVLSVKDENKN